MIMPTEKIEAKYDVYVRYYYGLTKLERETAAINLLSVMGKL